MIGAEWHWTWLPRDVMSAQAESVQIRFGWNSEQPGLAKIFLPVTGGLD